MIWTSRTEISVEEKARAITRELADKFITSPHLGNYEQSFVEVTKIITRGLRERMQPWESNTNKHLEMAKLRLQNEYGGGKQHDRNCREIAGWIFSALEEGDLDKARSFVSKLDALPATQLYSAMLALIKAVSPDIKNLVPLREAHEYWNKWFKSFQLFGNGTKLATRYKGKGEPDENYDLGDRINHFFIACNKVRMALPPEDLLQEVLKRIEDAMIESHLLPTIRSIPQATSVKSR